MPGNGSSCSSTSTLLDALECLRWPRQPRRCVDFTQSERCARFLTGVSKFSKVSLFSGLNNLTDITLEVAGIPTRRHGVRPELAGLDRDAIREWYNGYGWLGEDGSTTPSTSCDRKFGAWWFETGTPAFLVETLFRRRVSSVVRRCWAPTLSAFDVDDIAPRRCCSRPAPHHPGGDERREGALSAGLPEPGVCARASTNGSNTW